MWERVEDIDWSTWIPQDIATLLFVIRGGQALLIRKKRGLGAGKINAPGGRLEPGETQLEAAIREVKEEVGVQPIAPRERGELNFQFLDGYALRCHVFSADDCEGELIETDEATPMWTSLGALPYDEMWDDDRLWLPLLLSGRTPFLGRFIFDGETMRSHVIESHDPAIEVFATLTALSAPFRIDAHPPVFTVEQAKAHRVSEGCHVKNLFLRNKKGEMWLVTVPEDTRIDLKDLGRKIDAGHVSFASNERLRSHLGVEPGSVTPLAAIADRDAKVKVLLDRKLVDSERVHCHPMTNDRTVGLSGADLVKYLHHVGHPPDFVDFD
jgi:ADP-ribose pyrophosphatase YjhB (NUDIX family)